MSIGGPQALATILCHAVQCSPAALKLCRRVCVFLKALLMRGTLRPSVASALLGAPQLLSTIGRALVLCTEEEQVTEIDLMENCLFITQHAALHATVGGGGVGQQGPEGALELVAAVGRLQGLLSPDAPQQLQLAAIAKAVQGAFLP